jgi:hypothetical protein
MGGVSSRAQELARELTSNPFFPLLFIGKAAETSAFWTVGEASTNVVGVSYVMAFISAVLWLYTYDEVKWGLGKVEEAVEEATDNEEE